MGGDYETTMLESRTATPMLNSKLRPSSIALAVSLLFALGGIFAIDRALRGFQSHASPNRSCRICGTCGGIPHRACAGTSIRAWTLSRSRVMKSPPDSSNCYCSRSYNMHQHFIACGLRIRPVEFASRNYWGQKARHCQQGTRIDTVSQRPFRDAIQRARDESSHADLLDRAISHRRAGLTARPATVRSDQFIGFAGGTLTSKSILSFVEHQEPQPLGQIIIIAASDTMSSAHRHRHCASAPSNRFCFCKHSNSWRWQLGASLFGSRPLMRASAFFSGESDRNAWDAARRTASRAAPRASSRRSKRRARATVERALARQPREE